MEDKTYRAICIKCKTVSRHSRSKRWLDPFFLPDRCYHCDHVKSNRLFDTGWKIQYGFYKRKVSFNIFDPLTWAADYIWETIE